jgi:preprotein translocase subunit SecE
VARDRKRAKQRRDRQARSGGPLARHANGAAAAPQEQSLHEHEPPELASGDLDLADAQLALGRPELAEVAPVAPLEDADVAPLDEGPADEAEFEQLEDRVDDAEERFEDEGVGAGQDEVTRRPRGASHPAPRRDGSRLGNFLRGSSRELERVQWPDRRQVAQATAVVIGFVIVAGAFLGLMDLLAGKVVDFII